VLHAREGRIDDAVTALRAAHDLCAVPAERKKMAALVAQLGGEPPRD